MKLLSIDQSLKHSAFALFEDGEFKRVFSWKLKVDSTNDVCYGEFYNNIIEVILKEKPTVIICEKMFLGFNAAVFGKLSELTGMIRALCLDNNIPFEVIPIATYRSKLGVKNNKEVVTAYIKKSFPSIDFKNDDESDAFALGLGYLKILTDRESNVK